LTAAKAAAALEFTFTIPPLGSCPFLPSSLHRRRQPSKENLPGHYSRWQRQQQQQSQLAEQRKLLLLLPPGSLTPGAVVKGEREKIAKSENRVIATPKTERERERERERKLYRERKRKEKREKREKGEKRENIERI
jgi:hypothetical protein